MQNSPRPSIALASRRNRRRVVLASIVVAIVGAASLTGCTDDSRWNEASENVAGTETTSAVKPSSGAVVVASTSWVAALAKAAGASQITVIAPPAMQHPADYDPRPGDLAAIEGADYVLLGGFESFADRLTQASGSKAEVIKVNADNTPTVVREEVRKLAKTFGTSDSAEAWIHRFDSRITELQDRIAKARPNPAPTVVAHKFMAPWVDFAGLKLLGTFGPKPVSPSELAQFKADAPSMIFDNAHVPVGAALDELGAVKVQIINFPPESLDLLDVFEKNTESIIAGFGKL